LTIDYLSLTKIERFDLIKKNTFVSFSSPPFYLDELDQSNVRSSNCMKGQKERRA